MKIKSKTMKKYAMFLLVIGFIFTSCSNDDDGLGPGGVDPDPNADVTVQDFMWKAMNLWYFWQAEVPSLADDRFSTTEEYTNFLASETDPEQFYQNILFGEDRFSFLNSDYKVLTQSLSGVSKSNGLEFGLVLFSNSDEIFGYVRYVQPNSDAAGKNIARGDIFVGVDGQTLNTSNYIDLLFGDNDTYVLNMADISNDLITPNNVEVSLTKQENFVKNPVFLDKIIELNGLNIGYLKYNSFTNEFDEELNDAFGRFVAGGVSELVLDLRYNGGGSVNSSRLLSSMIYGTNSNNLYIKQRWNAKIQGQLTDQQLSDFFATQTSAGSAINTLNLPRVFVIADGSSASASELVMNGLAPYMDVIHIGETTLGKNEFSLTFVDDPANSYVYTPQTEDQINSDNSWAIQPLCGRNENADGFSDYTSGLAPDIELGEDLGNLGVLGDENEPLLARALQEIIGGITKRSFEVRIPINVFEDSDMMSPINKKMFLDKPLQFVAE